MHLRLATALFLVGVSVAELRAAQLRLSDATAFPGESAVLSLELAGALDVRRIEADLFLPRGVAFCFVAPASPSVRAYAFSMGGAVRLIVDAAGDGVLTGGPLATITIALNTSIDAADAVAVLERGIAVDRNAREIAIRPAAGVITIAGASGRRRAARREAPASSHAKIDEALRSGKIDAETALLYGVFADFGDSRLPGEYRGPDARQLESFVLYEVLRRFDSLSPQARETLTPFLTPAFYEGSWWDLRRSGKRSSALSPTCTSVSPFWSSIDGKYVKIWFTDPAERPLAASLALEIDTKIWDKLATNMGQPPLLDGGSSLLNPCRGGSDAIDIIFTDTFSAAPPHVGCSSSVGASPVYIYLWTKGAFQDPMRLAAHELMHAIQHSFSAKPNCDFTEYRWLLEGNAEWAMDLVYGKTKPPTLQDEHATGSRVMVDWGGGPNDYTPGLPLDYHDPGYPKACDHGYGTWVLPMFLAKKYGDDQFARRVAAAPSSLKAIPTVVSALGSRTLTEVWPELALSLWNQKPYDDFATWDAFDLTKAQPGARFTGAYPVPKFDPREVKAGETEIELDRIELDHLSMKYYHFTFKDERIRTVTFWNGLGAEVKRGVALFGSDQNADIYEGEEVDAAKKKGLFVRALLRTADGNWRKEEWSNEPFHTLCRDEKKDRITDLVLIITNSDVDASRKLKAEGLTPRLTFSNIGCYRYQGTMSFIVRGSTGTFIGTGDVTWTRKEPLNVYPARGGITFVPSGSMPVSLSGSSGGCTATGSGTISLAPTTATEFTNYLITANYVLPGTPVERAYTGLGMTVNTIFVTVTGQGCPPSGNAPVGQWFFAIRHTPGTSDGLPNWTVKPDGTIDDRWEQSGDGDSVSYVWTLYPKLEP